MVKKLAAVFMAFVLFADPVIGQDSQNITTPCNAHLGSIGATEPQAYEHYFEFARIPAAAEKFANEKLANTVETIAVAPVTSAEYQTIFARGDKNKSQPVTEAQQREIESVQSVLKAKYGREHGDQDFNDANFKQVLQAKAASFVIVIGHNEDGMLRLLDGKSVFLDEIIASARPDQRVILISCDSANRVSHRQVAGTVSRTITYDEAFDIAGKIAGFIKAAGHPVSLAEVQEQIVKEEQGSQIKHKVAFFVMKAVCAGAALIVVALIIRELDPCKDKDSSDCNSGKGNPKSTDGKAGEKRTSAIWSVPTAPNASPVKDNPLATQIFALRLLAGGITLSAIVEKAPSGTRGISR